MQQNKGTISLQRFLLNQDYYPLHLERIITEHLTLKAYINGQKVTLILDTGASQSCLHTKAAEDLGLTLSASEDKAAGIGTIEMEMSGVTVDLLTLGIFQTSNYQFAVIDLSHVNVALKQVTDVEIQGILGADVLMNYQAILDYKTQQLYLKQPAEKETI